MGATLSALAFVVVFWWWGDPTPFTWIAANPLLVLLGVAVYFVTGCAWGFAKWFLYLKERAREYQEARLEFLSRNDVADATLSTSVPEKLKSTWKTRSAGYRRPLAKDNKGRILMWMGYWPWSAVWTLVRDPFVHAYNACAELLEKMSSRIYDRVGFDQDRDAPADFE